MTYNIFIANNLILAQGVSTNIKVIAVQQQLALTQAVDKNLSNKVVADLLILSSLARVSKSISLSASNLLALTQQTYPRVRFIDVVTYLQVIHQVRREMPIVLSQLGLAQELLVDKVKPARSSLSLEHGVTLSITKALIAASHLVMDQDVNAYKPTEYFIQ